MEQIRQDRAPFHIVNSVLSQPVETLQKEKQGELCNEVGTEVISEDSKSQASLCDSIPGPFY